jgi:alpha-beta hydrolase superfamily lysophospholipase
LTDKSASSAPDDRFAGAEVQRTPIWFPSGGRQLWGWVHQPKAGSVWNGEAVVICNPIGHELLHAYRSVRHLADAMARNGFRVLRFDYSGTGDSEGDQLDEGIVDSWLSDIETAADLLRSRFASRTVHIAGVRGGALIAAASVEAAKIDGGLILWDPVLSGKRLLRELKANSRLAYFKSEPDMLQAAGFSYSVDMQERLQSLDIAESTINVNLPILSVARNDQPDSRLSQALRQQCPQFTQVEVHGFEEMLLEPHRTLVPFDAIDAAVNWLNGLTTSDSVSSQDAVTDTAAELRIADEGGDIVETAVQIGLTGMFGIYCRPATGLPADRPIVLFGNAGSTYRIGPSRLYVTLARQLALMGYGSIRYDLATIGDGLRFRHEEENRAYPVKAAVYITEVIEFAREELGHSSVILTGFCSGATLAFAAALAQLRTAALVEAIVVNPKVFYREDLGKNMENLVMRRASYYQRAIRDPDRWRRLLKGEIDFRQAATFVARRTRQMMKRTIRRILRVTGAGSGTRLGDDLQRYLGTGRRLSFFFSSRDPGLTVMLDSSGGIAKRLIDQGKIPVTVIEDADHTLTQMRCREDFIEKFINQVSTTYPVSD